MFLEMALIGAVNLRAVNPSRQRQQILLRTPAPSGIKCSKLELALPQGVRDPWRRQIRHRQRASAARPEWGAWIRYV